MPRVTAEQMGWAEFEQRLVVTLTELVPWDFVVIEPTDEAGRYVQYIRIDGDICAQCSGPSNVSLSSQSQDIVVSLSWNLPDENSGGNYWAWWTPQGGRGTLDPEDYAEAAALGVRTLREVLELTAPPPSDAIRRDNALPKGDVDEPSVPPKKGPATPILKWRGITHYAKKPVIVQCNTCKQEWLASAAAANTLATEQGLGARMQRRGNKITTAGNAMTPGVGTLLAGSTNSEAARLERAYANALQPFMCRACRSVDVSIYGT
jgi:hypothetical protein